MVRVEVAIEKIILENFESVTNAEYDLDAPVVSIQGRNGTGKSTIKCAHNWIWGDCDEKLNKNPDIRMLHHEDLDPKAIEILRINDTPVSVEKEQKRSKTGAISNKFYINDVPKNKTEFELWFADKGIDVKNLIIYSDPSAFMRGKSADIRKALFGMVKDTSDVDIASGIGDEVKETAELLKDHTLEEVNAMQNKKLKDIYDKHGRKGEITKAAIAENKENLAKYSDCDFAELELQKNALNEQIQEIDKKIDEMTSEAEELKGKDMHLQFEMSGIVQKMNEEVRKNHSELSTKHVTIESKMNANKQLLQTYKNRIDAINSVLKEIENQKEPINEAYKKNNERIYNESDYISSGDMICKMCGRPLQEEKIAEVKEHAKAEFLKDKESVKAGLIEKANILKTKYADLMSESASLSKQIRKLQEQIASAESKLKELATQRDSAQENVDYMQDAEYAKMYEERKDILARINNIESGENSEVLKELENSRLDVLQQLNDVNAKLALAPIVNDIEQRISNLQKLHTEREQERADCEKIKYQIDLINKKKNSTLEDAINENFSIVKWRLFKQLKNGEIVDDCTPIIDGFAYEKSTNKGREILARLDICYGLQRYYDTYFPVFADDMESLDENKFLGQAGTQLIALIHKDCDFEIKKSED